MKTIKKKIKFIIEKTDTGFSGYSNDSPVFTTGKNFTELLANATEALNLFFEGQNNQVTSDDIQFEIDLQQFFQYYRVINAKFLAQRIGMNETLLSQYVKGKKKPSQKQTDKILQGIQEIGRELTNINIFT
jgi:predicted RNase H-like HicB family nuclease